MSADETQLRWEATPPTRDAEWGVDREVLDGLAAEIQALRRILMGVMSDPYRVRRDGRFARPLSIAALVADGVLTPADADVLRAIVEPGDDGGPVGGAG